MLLLSHAPALFATWVAWCLVHSLLASRRVKKWLYARLGLSPRRYRLYYVLFSTCTLAALVVWQLRVVPLPVPAPLPWQVVRLLLCASGAYLLYAGGQAYPMGEFLGLTAPAGGEDPNPIPFRREGILARVRHPWYAGGLALLVGIGATPGDRLDWRLLLMVYLVCGCLIEERRLVAELGEVYRQYQREVPMLLPRLRRAAADKRHKVGTDT